MPAILDKNNGISHVFLKTTSIRALRFGPLHAKTWFMSVNSWRLDRGELWLRARRWPKTTQAVTGPKMDLSRSS